MEHLHHEAIVAGERETDHSTLISAGVSTRPTPEQEGAIATDSAATGEERWLQELFTPNLLHDLLLAVPGMSLLEVKAALLFVGKGEMFILHSQEQGPKWLTRETVRSAFSLIPTDSGMLPPGVFRYGTGMNGEPWMAISIPPAYYTLQLIQFAPTLISLHIPLPGFVFAGRERSYFLWAVKEPIIRAETSVYVAPLPNVAATGQVCYGNVSPPRVSGDSMLPAFRLFMDSLFNGHHVDYRSRTYPGDIRYLLEEIAREKQRTYPYDDLLPVSFRRGQATVEDVLSSIIAR